MAGRGDNGVIRKTGAWARLRTKLWLIAILGLFLAVFSPVVQTQAWGGDLWKITFYCPCEICNGKWPGIAATGHRLDDGIVACNILPIGTVVHIEGFGYRVVMDRGAKKYFDNQKHIDIYVSDHEKARWLGVKWRKVEVIRQVANNERTK